MVPKHIRTKILTKMQTGFSKTGHRANLCQNETKGYTDLFQLGHQSWFTLAPSMDTITFLANSIILTGFLLICNEAVKISFRTQRQTVRPVESPIIGKEIPVGFVAIDKDNHPFIGLRGRIKTLCSHFLTVVWVPFFPCFPLFPDNPWLFCFPVHFLNIALLSNFGGCHVLGFYGLWR